MFFEPVQLPPNNPPEWVVPATPPPELSREILQRIERLEETVEELKNIIERHTHRVYVDIGQTGTPDW